MAGTLFGLSLSQPVDLNGRPQVGNKLYIYEAGSFTIPATAYKDYGLTVGQEHPFPIPADAWGRQPIHWLADGSYAFRLVDADGIALASALTVQALGPSSGAGGGGSTVDENALLKTGYCLWMDVSGTLAGFVRDNGRTIGSATSGATERANADCSALYTYLWTTYSNTICPVTGGRGLSAPADFSANKPIQLPDKRGFVPGGLDDMGNSAAGQYTGVPVISGSVTTAGSLIGESKHTLTSSEVPSLPVTGSGTVQPTVNGGQQLWGWNNGGSSGGLSGSDFNVPTTSRFYGAETKTVNITGTATGGGGSANITQKTVLGTFYRKL